MSWSYDRSVIRSLRSLYFVFNKCYTSLHSQQFWKLGNFGSISLPAFIVVIIISVLNGVSDLGRGEVKPHCKFYLHFLWVVILWNFF